VLKNELRGLHSPLGSPGARSELQGDQIYNGAIDNASESPPQTLLEIAEAFAKTTDAPKRSILFLGSHCRREGIAGLKYYATNPLYPLNKTLANKSTRTGSINGVALKI